MDRKEQLKQVIWNSNDELQQLESQERFSRNVDLVGRYYKFHNSYSCPQNESDYWWIYQRITGINEYGNLQAISFATDKNNKMTIEEEHSVYLDRWIEITEDEFRKQWNKFVTKINQIVL
jgi:hypothetical protein